MNSFASGRNKFWWHVFSRLWNGRAGGDAQSAFFNKKNVAVPSGRMPAPQGNARPALPDERLAYAALTEIMRTAECSKSGDVLIRREKGKLAYQLTSADGRAGKGFIHAKLRDAMLTLLESLARAEHERVTHYRRPCYIVRELLRGDEYSLTRTSLEPAGVGDSDERRPAAVCRVQGEPTSPERHHAGAALEVQAEAAPVQVLLVDDNALFARSVTKYFFKHNLQLLHLSSGHIALERIQSGSLRPAVILCDVHMPELNGFEYLKALRAMDCGRALPVIMLTSDNDDDVQVSALAAGADAFVAKQEHPKILLAHVRHFLSKN